MQHEIAGAANDPDGTVAASLARIGNQVAITEAFMSFGFRTKPGAAEVKETGGVTLAGVMYKLERVDRALGGDAVVGGWMSAGSDRLRQCARCIPVPPGRR